MASNLLAKLKREQEELIERTKRVDKSQDGDARLYMTALKCLMPIIDVVISKADKAITREDLVKQITNLFKASNDLSSSIAEDLISTGINPYTGQNRWTIRQILAAATSSTSAHWARYGNKEINILKDLYSAVIIAVTGKLTASSLALTAENVDMLSNIPKHKELDIMIEAFGKDDKYYAHDLKPALLCSLMSAMQPIIMEIERFCWFKDNREAISIASENIIRGANWLFNAQIKVMDFNEVSLESRKMLLQNCISRSGTFYAEVWRTKAYDDLMKIQSMNIDDRLVWAKEAKENKHSFEIINVTFDTQLLFLSTASIKAMENIKFAVFNDNDATVKKCNAHPEQHSR